MGIRAFSCRRLRVGDTFTENNLPELVGQTVFEVGEDTAYKTVGLTLLNGHSLLLPFGLVVEVDRA